MLQHLIEESIDHIRPFLSWADSEPRGLEQQRLLITRWDENWESNRGTIAYGIFQGGVPVGGSNLKLTQGSDAVEIGYWVHPRYVCQGIATRASRALAFAVLETFPGSAVEIRHDVRNIASAAIPRRLGFAQVSSHEVDDNRGGRYVEMVWQLRLRDFDRNPQWLARELAPGPASQLSSGAPATSPTGL